MSTDYAVTWAILKAFVTSRSLFLQYIDTGDTYYLFAFDGQLGLSVLLPKDGGADQTDFETNFKPTANRPLEPKDTDGSALARAKQTTAGWTFQDHVFEFKAGTLGSVYSKNAAGVDFGFSTLSFYELVSGAEALITGANASDQTYLTANAVRTDILWEMTSDFDVLAGELRFYDTVITDIRLWVVVAPDIPYAYGGSRELLTGGRNLRHVRPQDPIVIDGRTCKHLVYSGTYHTNKFRITLRHAAGLALAIETSVQLYKL